MKISERIRTNSKRMILRIGGLLAAMTLTPVISFSAQDDKVIISYSSRDFSFLPGHVAVAKGFFKDEGIEPVMVQMRPPLAAPALTTSDIHYTTTFGSTLNAIMQGVPLKMLAVITEKSPYYIVARPGIKTVPELRGKKIAAQQRGLSDRVMAEAILEAKGVDLKDVQFVTLSGDLPVRMSALTSGLVDAVCLLPPGPVLLERDGYRIIAGPNDVKLGVPTNGLSTTNQRLAEKRNDVRKVLRAMLRGLRFVRERRDETVSIMAQWLSQKPDVAARSYDLIIAGYSQDGIIGDATWNALIENRVQSFGLAKPASLDQVRDLNLAREVQKELR